MAPKEDDPRLHQELLLHSNTDCAQFCPVEWGRGGPAAAAAADDGARAGHRPAADWLAVATYELDESTRTRTGSLILYTLEKEEEDAEAEEEQQPRLRRRRHRLALSARRDALPGVFDAQWLRLLPGWAGSCEAEWALSLALSDGRLVVLAVEEQQQEEEEEEATGGANPTPRRLHLTQVAEWQAIRGPEEHEDDPTKRMALMVAWERPDGQRAAVSGSGGTVAVMAAGGGNTSSANPWSEWKAHDLEAWAVAFDPWRPPALYSGSDDASLKLWDLRMARRSSSGSGGSGSDAGAPAAAATPALLLCDKRTHAAGVTCISPHPSREFILATGSYDEKARLWDARRPRCPLAEVDVGGGAWRLQWRPAVEASGGGDRDGGDLILAACMYNGFAVLRATVLDGGEDWGLEAAERLAEPHESIAYGCDWWRGGGGGAGAVVATASFYDRRLCLWQPRTTTT
jgi:hypothetical protein